MHFQNNRNIYLENLAPPQEKPGDNNGTLKFIVADEWSTFQLRFTAGEDLTVLTSSLTDVVEAFERYADALLELPDEDYYPPFIMNDMIDTFVDYLHLLCFAVLLHREDLIPRIHALNEDTDFDGVDAVIEQLFKFYLSDQPALDVWLWNKSHRTLLDAIDSDTPAEMAKEMKNMSKADMPA